MDQDELGKEALRNIQIERELMYFKYMGARIELLQEGMWMCCYGEPYKSGTSAIGTSPAIAISKFYLEITCGWNDKEIEYYCPYPPKHQAIRDKIVKKATA